MCIIIFHSVCHALLLILLLLIIIATQTVSQCSESDAEHDSWSCCGPVIPSKWDTNISVERTSRDDNNSANKNNTNNKLTFRLIGGEEVDNVANFPWQVSLNATNQETGLDNFCSGVIVGPRSILTAAHCVFNSRSISIRYDSLFATSGGRVITSRDYILHPDYNSTNLMNDIAVIRLSRPIVTVNQLCRSSKYSTVKSSLPQAICLPLRRIFGNPPWYTMYGYSYTVAGWGRTSLTNPQLSDVLQSISVRIAPLDQCARMYRKYASPNQTNMLTRFNQANRDKQKIFCANSPGKSICLGDSGGPLFTVVWARRPVPQAILLGIVSATFSCGLFNVPDVYTRVDSYLGWIGSIVRADDNEG